MPLLFAIIIFLLLWVSEKNKVIKSDKLRSMYEEQGAFLPEASERERLDYDREIIKDWQSERKLFPKELQPYFEKNKTALFDYMIALTEKREIDEGYRPHNYIGMYNKYTYDNFKNVRKDILAPETISVWQKSWEVLSENDSSNSVRSSNSYSVIYYNAISLKLAKQLAAELEARVIYYEAQKIELPAPAEGSLSYYEHSDGTQYLIVQYDSHIELITYRGDSSLSEYADTFISYLTYS